MFIRHAFASTLLLSAVLVQAQVETTGVVSTFDGYSLSLPAVQVDDDFYAIEFSVTSDDEPSLILQAAVDRPSPLQYSQTSFFSENILTIPCLRTDDGYFQLTAELAQQEPTIQFNNLAATPVPACDQQLPGHLTFMSPHANPVVVLNDKIFVTNTPAATVDVIDSQTLQVVNRIQTGIDPVALAVKPDGTEVWVSNHVSDSVSVIDVDSESQTYLKVIATIQDIDSVTKSTLFDEPVGIAFADDNKAFVALSSLDRIAIIDVQSRTVTGHITIKAQDPRAITVRNGKLYVTAFESNNKTELSGCFGTIDGDQCTFSLQEHVVSNNNVLSLGYDADIVKDPRVPDRDLFVFDAATNATLDTVSSVGTLLYGVVVDSNDKVFIAQTDARNDANGRAGTLKHTLLEMENRAFLNQIGVVDCGSDCGFPSTFELEPLPPAHPDPGQARATPYGIAISDNDEVLVATAASSDLLFTVDANSGQVLGQVEVDSVPRGVALESDTSGAPSRAWVLNAVSNSVSVVDINDPNAPLLISTIVLDDPTPSFLKQGRAMFASAKASSTGTFSCESCHPDGHTDQLLWVLDGPQCEITGCTQIPVRSTMPIRGLRDTAPFHWDGVPGDPYGGRNGKNPGSIFPANCDLDVPESCTLNLVDGSLSSTMCDPVNCPTNEAGKAGLLTTEERDALAQFILSIPHPPARERSFDDGLSESAIEGFDEFFIQDAPAGSVANQTCGSVGCHAMPFWTGTNDAGSGMDAPSFRGLQDRWLMLPQGRVNMWELINSVLGTKGFDEFTMWNQIISGSTQNEWQMFVEASMGFPGVFARQITLNQQALNTENLTDTIALLDALETSAEEGTSVLQGDGVDTSNESQTDLSLVFDNGSYQQRVGSGSYTREELISLATNNELVVTLTAHLPNQVSYDYPQPGIWSTQNQFLVSKHAFPRLSENEAMRLKGRHIHEGAQVFVNGRKVAGSVQCESGTLPNCNHELILVQLDQLPAETGMYFLQVQTPGGLMSNEYIFHVD